MTEMNALIQMEAELQSHCLHTILVPLDPRKRNWNEGGCKRVNCDVPPLWFRRLCQKHTSSRGVRKGKHDSRIRRQNVLNTLRSLLAGKHRSKYDAELLGIAQRIARAA